MTLSVKVLSSKEAVGLIKDGDTLVVGGCASVCEPDALLAALEERFVETGHPRDLTEVHPTMVGDRVGRGISVFSHPGMLKRIIGGSYVSQRAPEVRRMIFDNEIEAYNLPMGALYFLLRAIGSGSPGYLTEVGIGTFVDPRCGGGKLNTCTTEDLVTLVEIAGKEYLMYKSFPVDVVFIRGTAADENGNISMDEEAASLDMFGLALAGKACGGTVIAQVKRLVKAGSLDPRLVRVPGHMVDAVVLSPSQRQSSAFDYNPSWSGGARECITRLDPLPLDEHKVILRRAALELRKGQLVNIGFGLPGTLPRIAIEEGIFDSITFSIEHGMIGGIPSSTLTSVFPAAVNPEVIVDTAQQFSVYDGGLLDITFLGFAQFDRHGNVNVSKFASAIPGCGGFIDITHKTRRIVFCGTFTAGGLEVAVDTSGVKVVKEGAIRKIVGDVEQVTLNGELAAAKGQEILYVTERCVFKLTQEGPVLVEIAPGIDLERDIISLVEFPIPVSEDLRTMDARIFQPGRMELSKSF